MFSYVLASVSILVTLLYNHAHAHMIELKVNQTAQVGDCVVVGSMIYKYEGKGRQMLKIILRHFEGISNTFLEGLEVCAYIIPGFKLVRHSVSLSFSVNVFLHRHIRGYKGYSLVGNDTAILLSFKPQIQHKKPK